MRVNPRRPSIAWTARAFVLGPFAQLGAVLTWMWDAAPWQVMPSTLVGWLAIVVLGGVLDIRVDRKRGIVP